MAVAKMDEYIEREAAEVMFDEADALAAEELEALEAELDDATLAETELDVVPDKLVEEVPLEALMLV
jgi:hypothetical protein